MWASSTKHFPLIAEPSSLPILQSNAWAIAIRVNEYDACLFKR